MSAISTKPESAVVSPVAFSLSTISAKAVLAVTGVLLIGFLLAHLAGNLLIFKGQDSLNAYAQFLKSQGPVLWVARLGLLAVFVLHLGMALQLAKRKREARPQKYVFEKTIQASVASRYMLHTGIIILLFLLLHLAHYTLGLVGTANGSNYLELLDKEGRHDVYRMVIAGFTNPWFSVFYIVCQIALGLHLYHGASSMFQTMGINHIRHNAWLQRMGLLFAIVIAGGNIAIVLSVWLGLVK